MAFSSSVKSTKVLDWKSFEQPLTGALSKALQTGLTELQKEIKGTVLSTFYFPGNPDRLTTRWFARKGNGILSAELSYKFEAVSLSRYPVNQFRVTVGKKILRVRRGGGAAGNRFSRQVVDVTATMTEVMIRKGKGWQLVKGKAGPDNKGRPGYMGWLHTGTKGKFASKIFERNQQETWRDNQRLPVHALWGPSLVQLLRSPEVQKTINDSKNLQRISDILLKEIQI
jgi:hypothetical protein